MNSHLFLFSQLSTGTKFRYERSDRGPVFVKSSEDGAHRDEDWSFYKVSPSILIFPVTDLNDYLVTGTRRQQGAIGNPENFQEKIPANSSRDAYFAVLNTPGYTHVHVVAIKMKCGQCQQHHITVPTELYLGD